MAQIFYAVTAEMPAELAPEYLSWLRGGHVEDVIDAGALRGQVVMLEVEEGLRSVRIETQYLFANRQSYDAYVEGPAHALRAEGREKFPQERGITFERRIGEVQ